MNIKTLVKISHMRQFNGEDFQSVAIDLAGDYGILFDSDDYTAIQSAPSEGCDCGFCENAPWEN